MNIKLEVIRINEDVIATSCSEAVFYTDKEFNITCKFETKKDFEKWTEDYKGDYEDIEAYLGYFAITAPNANNFHITEDYKIEVCNNPDAHKANQNGWKSFRED